MSSWTDKQPVPDWGRCSRCGAPLASSSELSPSREWCTKSGWRDDDFSFCGWRTWVRWISLAEHQSNIRAARRAYAAAMLSLEENRPS